MGAVLLAVAGCSAAGVERAPPLPPPPRLPGYSIEHSTLCSCMACPRCCGAEPDAAEPVSELGLAVTSCEARCTRVTWRVAGDAPCDTRRPRECCDG